MRVLADGDLLDELKGVGGEHTDCGVIVVTRENVFTFSAGVDVVRRTRRRAPINDLGLTGFNLHLHHLAGVLTGTEHVLTVGTQSDVVEAKRKWHSNQPLQHAGLQIDLTDSVGALVVDIDVSAIRGAVLISVVGAAIGHLMKIHTNINMAIGLEARDTDHGYSAVQATGVIHDHRIMQRRISWFICPELPAWDRLITCDLIRVGY